VVWITGAAAGGESPWRKPRVDAPRTAQNIIEYGLLIATIVIVVLIAVTSFGHLIEPTMKKPSCANSARGLVFHLTGLSTVLGFSPAKYDLGRRLRTGEGS
jgi:hypothetical protein